MQRNHSPHRSLGLLCCLALALSLAGCAGEPPAPPEAPETEPVEAAVADTPPTEECAFVLQATVTYDSVNGLQVQPPKICVKREQRAVQIQWRAGAGVQTFSVCGLDPLEFDPPVSGSPCTTAFVTDFSTLNKNTTQRVYEYQVCIEGGYCDDPKIENGTT